MQRGLVGSEMCIRDRSTQSTWELSKILTKHTPYVEQILEVQASTSILKDSKKYIITEVLSKYGGKNIMELRDKNKLANDEILEVVFQSALALTTAHTLGYFHCNIRPENMLFHEGKFQFINFDTINQRNTTSLIRRLKEKLENDLQKNSKVYYPPELLYFEELGKKVDISLEKIDVYCWAISIYQFLTSISYSTLESRMEHFKTAKFKNIGLIKSTEITNFKKETSAGLMKVLCKCLKLIPFKRMNMKSVLACLIDSNKEFSGIISGFNSTLQKLYTQTIIYTLSKFISPPQLHNLIQIGTLQVSVEHLRQRIPELLQPACKKIEVALKKSNIFACPIFNPVSYTHLTLPTILLVQISVVAVSLKKKKNHTQNQRIYASESGDLR
eukprot:TRINITY_DN13250_c0_g1_i2.p1 TRINITY_DN13250_c0_g1~~TRINITY_DN13250_c0_g1_i2.p1  ORF type:complete len:386 (+),score=72.07 TRINITY_DN13250_c0_g1_i2:121-1278(+)